MYSISGTSTMVSTGTSRYSIRSSYSIFSTYSILGTSMILSCTSGRGTVITRSSTTTWGISTMRSTCRTSSRSMTCSWYSILGTSIHRSTISPPPRCTGTGRSFTTTVGTSTIFSTTIVSPTRRVVIPTSFRGASYRSISRAPPPSVVAGGGAGRSRTRALTAWGREAACWPVGGGKPTPAMGPNPPGGRHFGVGKDHPR
mmetsp:Transcript_8059/g.19098  ORF Transcript_8059/g.19098 Transcript_8059/m.19098 type:complete len:200 (+) Transcript_8059:556-1155(+)